MMDTTTMLIGITIPYKDLKENHKNIITKTNEIPKKYINSFHILNLSMRFQ